MDEVRALKREVRRLEYELKASIGHLPLLRAMVEGSRDGLALLSDEGHVIEHNSAFAIMLGTSEGLLGAPLDALLSRNDSTEALWPPSNDDLPLIVNPRRGEFLELVIARIDTDARRLWVANIRLLTEATLQMRALAEARRRVADLTVELDAQRRFAALFEHSSSPTAVAPSCLPATSLLTDAPRKRSRPHSRRPRPTSPSARCC